MSDYVQKLVDAVRAEQIRKLKEDGWTPPPVKPEPEFKPGDYVEVRSHNENWRLDRFIRLNSSDYPYDCERGAYLECRHAPTWIKWEDGHTPDLATDGQVLGYVYTDIHGKAFLSMNDGRWAWMSD